MSVIASCLVVCTGNVVQIHAIKCFKIEIYLSHTEKIVQNKFHQDKCCFRLSFRALRALMMLSVYVQKGEPHVSKSDELWI